MKGIVYEMNCAYYCCSKRLLPWNIDFHNDAYFYSHRLMVRKHWPKILQIMQDSSMLIWYVFQYEVL